MYNLLNFKVENLAKEFNSDLERGLNTNQVNLNTEKYGKNTLKFSTDSIFSIFLSQFNIFVFLLFFSSFFSLYMGEILDFYILLSFALLDIVLGFIQEYKSFGILQTLNKLNQFEVSVIRDGIIVHISRDEVLPGDVVFLKSGDLIPADTKIITSSNLVVDESSITGDSSEIEKNNLGNFDDKILYSGTVITEGSCKGIVVYTGKKSRIGHISKTLSHLDSETVYQKETKKLSELIFKIVALSLTIAVLINYFYRVDTFYKFLIYAVSLAVTVIPEALPLIITFSLSNGALKLFKRKVLVKRLPSIEDLGGIDVLCTDKTGTLTENNLVFINKISLGNFDFEKLIYLSINSLNHKDSFDKALRNYSTLQVKHHILDEFSFDPVRKRSSVLTEYNNKRYLIVKGAFEILNMFDHISHDQRAVLSKFNHDESEKGRRVLLFGFKEVSNDTILEKDENDLQLEGAVSFEDQIKFSSFDSIKKAQELNIDIKVLTGDSLETSFYVAEKLGIVSSRQDVVSSEELKNLKGEKLIETVEGGKVFCRLNPDEKVKVIKILQTKHLVGYLGEGINDAPALKVANVGVASFNSSDIARSSADIILMKKSLDHLIEGIIEGRKIFQNITKYIKITISANFGNFFALLISSFFVPFLPLLPIQVLLIHILSDIPLMFVSTDNVDKEDLEKPSKSDFDSLLKLTLLLGFVSSIFDFIIFGYFKNFGESTLHSTWFFASILTEILIIYSLRSKRPFFKSSSPSMALAISSIMIIVSSLFFLFNPTLMFWFEFKETSFNYLYLVVIICITYFVVSEIVKNAFYSKKPAKIV